MLKSRREVRGTNSELDNGTTTSLPVGSRCGSAAKHLSNMSEFNTQHQKICIYIPASQQDKKEKEDTEEKTAALKDSRDCNKNNNKKTPYIYLPGIPEKERKKKIAQRNNGLRIKNVAEYKSLQI